MGERIRFEDGRWIVSDRPVIPFIEGDGTGPDIWRAARRVFDAAVEKTARGKRRVEWLEILAGEKAFKETGSWLPDATLETIRQHRVAIKGPLTTPVGGGIRSLNVTLRGEGAFDGHTRSEEHTSELQSHHDLVCRLLLEK